MQLHYPLEFSKFKYQRVINYSADTNYGDKIIYCAMYLYVGYINEATNFAESQGGGGSDTKDWGREKDEDEIEWIRRCLRQATKMMKPMKRKGLSR